MNHKYSKFTFILILSVCAVAPISIDIFVSGLPAMSNAFQGKNIALVLSITLLGLAIGQPIYGPLLDRYGRKPVLLGGLIIFTLAGCLVMLAHTFESLLLGRFLQAIGACGTTVSVFAIARDYCDKEQLVKMMGIIMATIGVSPIIAPLIGSFLNSYMGWRASFIFLVALGILYIIIIQVLLRETLATKNLQALGFKSIIANYLRLAKTRGFLSYCFGSGFSYSVLFSYLNLSAFFIIEKMHFGLIEYGWIVAINAIAIIVMATVAPNIAKAISLLKTVFLGFVLITIGGLLMTIVNIYQVNNIYTFMIPMFITTIGAGIIRPTASASAMQLADRSIAGSASAFFNFTSFVCGAIASAISLKVIFSISEFGLFITLMGGCALILVLATCYLNRKLIASM